MESFLNKLISLSESVRLTSSLEHLKQLYDSGIYIDYIDVACTVSYHLKKENGLKWEKDIMELMEKYRPDIELCQILRRRFRA